MPDAPARAPTSLHHPRRALPHQSVSLRHPRSSVLRKVASTGHDSPALRRNKNSSGETSNAEQWFDNSNQNVSQHRRAYKDNDSPFFFDNNTSDSPPLPVNPTHLPLRTLTKPQTSPSSSYEDYRSVIDDLTVENQKLKKRLHKYKKTYSPNIDGEKLFEVKVHGLSAAKKLELEEMLRKFAVDLDASPVSDETAASSSAARALPPAFAGKPGSSRSSTRFADSGYGSMTASKSHSTLTSSAARQAETSTATNRSIHSYLHDIPEGLLPRHPPAMTERSKKMLVVRRLEQIFDGRGPTPGIHRQPQQQQEVSQSAARADKSALEALGRKAPAEGIREARIMTNETEDPTDVPSVVEAKRTATRQEKQEEEESSSMSNDLGITSLSPSPEQRPTRPLDLDPDRAQDPADNIHYIQHLGFLALGDEEPQPAVDGHTWIYLNLLIGMAQLHTINVTPDFVKRAITDYSSRLELSEDGRKVRWKGGDENGNASAQSSSGTEYPVGTVDGHPTTRKRTLPADSDAALDTPKRLATDLVGHEDRWVYNPLFSHKLGREDSDSSMMDSGFNSDSPMPDSHTAATATGASRQTMPRKRQGDGPMIFYSNAKFCTDLSGEPRMSLQKSTLAKMADYVPCTKQPLGTIYEARESIRERDNFLKAISQPPAPSTIDEESSLDLFFPSSRSPKSVTFAEPEEAMPLEASGIGGVTPDDNFAITVIRKWIVDISDSTAYKRTTLGHKLASSCSHTPFCMKERVVSTRVSTLDPSPLPPAMMDFHESSDNDSDSEASFSVFSTASSDSLDLHPIHATSPRLTLPSKSRYAQSEDSNSSHSISSTTPEYASQPGTTASPKSPPHQARSRKVPAASASAISDDADTVDFLASVRRVNPEIVRVQEREYDAEVAERLAEEIPAGSSAATAGGGSGFTSPELMAARTSDDGSSNEDSESDVDNAMSVRS